MFQNIGSLHDYIHNINLSAAVRRRMEEQNASIEGMEKSGMIKNEWNSEEYARARVEEYEGEKDFEYERICRKLDYGCRLAESEIAYLEAGYPEKHKYALEIIGERDICERSFLSARYKEEVEEIKNRFTAKWLGKADGFANSPYIDGKKTMQMLVKASAVIAHIENAFEIFRFDVRYIHMPLKADYDSYSDSDGKHPTKMQSEYGKNTDGKNSQIESRGVKVYKDTGNYDYEKEMEKIRTEFFRKV